MNFTRDPVSSLSIRKVEHGSITIGNDEFTENVSLFRHDVQPFPAIPDVAAWHERLLDDLLRAEPEILIVGSGWTPQRPPRELVFAMARRGVGFEVMDTPAACRTYNILIAEGRGAAAVLVID